MTLYVDIQKKLGDFQLDVQLEAGNEVFGLLGASGCGKSMTLKAVAGVVTPDAGEIVLDGQVLFDSKKKINLTPQQRQVGYLFQNYALFPNMTVADNIAVGIRLPKSQRGAVVADNIRRFYLEGLEKHYPTQLSGGQQQRVALARIVASKPLLLMLDEPFSALDSYLKWQLEQEISQLLEEFSGTAIFVSHNRDEVFRLCHRIAVMGHGQIDVCEGKWDLFAQPQTLASSLLTGCKNHSTAHKIDDHTIEALEWQIQLCTEQVVPDDVHYVGIRAHFLEQVNEPGENTFLCHIQKAVEDTFSYIIMVQLQNGSVLSAPIRWELDKERWRSFAATKAPLYLRLPPEKLLMMER